MRGSSPCKWRLVLWRHMPGNILQNLQGLRLFGAFGPSRLCTRVVTLREATVAEQVEKRDRPA